MLRSVQVVEIHLHTVWDYFRDNVGINQCSLWRESFTSRMVFSSIACYCRTIAARSSKNAGLLKEGLMRRIMFFPFL